MMDDNYIYNAGSASGLTDDEIDECHALYNNNYGYYRKDSARRPGEPVWFPKKKYYEYKKEGFFVATARYNGKLVAHAFYIRKKYPEYGVMTWVLQLVVHKEHRKKGIAGRLLHSIWGFSDDYAWGLASANPCTVKTLESATYRTCRPVVILKELDAVKMIAKDTTFISDDSFDVGKNHSFVDTKFFVDNMVNSSLPEIENALGKLEPGYEWLAMTFQSQKPLKSLYRKHFKDLLDFSEEKLREAYSRMDMNNHPWTAKTVNEVDFLCKYLRGTAVLDMGCGHGRHSLELASRGYDVTGIDYVREHIDDARHTALEKRVENVSFLVDDLRGTRLGNKFDSIICLYDVIGSFPNARDNIKLVKTAYENLKNGGVFVLSVMNMELTEKLVKEENKLSVCNNPEALFKLKASSAMQNSGNIFEGDAMIIDTDTGLVYRKEQFDNGNELSAEYIIRDKRYTMDEITKILSDAGFTVVEKKYTNAGFTDFYEADDNRSKEILIVAEKNILSTR